MNASLHDVSFEGHADGVSAAFHGHDDGAEEG